MSHWYPADETAVVGYVVANRTAIVAGAPVCEKELLGDTVTKWEAFAKSRKLSVCYFGAEDRLQQELGTKEGYTSVTLGSQPIWNPANFVRNIENEASLRAQIRRSLNKGVRVSEWDDAKARRNPQLEEVLSAWIKGRGMPTLHFLVEPDTLGDLRDRRVFVATQKDRVVGFVTLCPSPARNGWLTEQFVRTPNAPNGTVELMLYFAAKACVEAECTYFTMGIVPLVLPSAKATFADPFWLSILRRWAEKHYTRFYNFKGLKQFKAKYKPDDWEPVVVIVKGKRFGLSHLRTIVKAFTVCEPELALIASLFWQLGRRKH